MKRITWISCTILFVWIAFSCSDDDLMYDVHQKRSIYFDRENKVDTIFFSFVSVEGDSYNYQIPIKAIGKPVHEIQKPVVSVITDSMTAREGMHYVIGEMVIPADSIRGFLSIQLKKTEEMKKQSYSLYLRFVENEYFKPIADDNYILSITDGEYTRPDWWKDADLGTFSSGLFKRILEKYWELEEVRPVEYAYFEENYGRLLENAPAWFWSNQYPTIWVKFVLKPVYEYYQEHPTEGVNMPNPDKFLK